MNTILLKNNRPEDYTSLAADHYFDMWQTLRDSQYTLVCLKRGLGCVAIYGESPDFLEKYFFAKTQKSSFFGKVLFFENAKVLIFWKNAIFGRGKSTNCTKNSRHAYLKSFLRRVK